MRIAVGVGCLAALLGGSLGSSGNRVEAQEEQAVLGQDAKEALARYAELRTLPIKWVQEIEPGAVAESKLDAEKLASWSRPESCYLVWQGGKMFRRRHEGSRGWQDGSQTSQHEVAFDGRTLAGSRPHLSLGEQTAAPVLTLHLASSLDPDAEYFGVEHLQQLGIHFPSGMGDLLRTNLLSSQVLFLVLEGRLKEARLAALDGRPHLRVVIDATARWCDVLEYPGKDRLWIDHERPGAIVVRGICDPRTGLPVQRIEATGHREVQPGIWVPIAFRNLIGNLKGRTSDGTYQSSVDALLRVVDVRLNEDVAEQLFEFEPLPGSLEYDEDNGLKRETPGTGDYLEGLAVWATKHFNLTPQLGGHEDSLAERLLEYAVIAMGLSIFALRWIRPTKNGSKPNQSIDSPDGSLFPSPTEQS
jgi:hypothetical protein